MIIRLGVRGGLAALALLLAPGWASAQAILTWGSDHPTCVGCPTSNGNAGLGDITSSPFDPSFGPKGQDAPPRSGLEVRVYNAKMEYARGFVDLQLGKFHEAEGEFNNALQVQPDDMKSLYMLGVARSGEGDLQGALRAFEHALKLDPLQISVKREYAVTLARLGQADKAKAQLKALTMLSDVCDGACAQADDYKAALARVQAALSGTLNAPG